MINLFNWVGPLQTANAVKWKAINVRRVIAVDQELSASLHILKVFYLFNSFQPFYTYVAFPREDFQLIVRNQARDYHTHVNSWNIIWRATFKRTQHQTLFTSFSTLVKYCFLGFKPTSLTAVFQVASIICFS
jgi:hypothetical protein